MPLLMCPNDNAPMQTLERSGVQFDMCPSCRGVWLDRGELEKLMAAASEDGRAQAAPAPQAAPTYTPAPQQPQYQQPQGYSPRYRDDDDYKRYKKRKRLDIFDIFD
ncbi:zf-TFIIB domain-containing protein [Brevundimonas sp. 2R-24]|uniref:Zf-TFIIB domain-containing protein n=1 Tax=Peiella sedimenti TaxID=3061083 RepID=A0ABT8SMS2_9CAUL|nr:zf-TFIIB domain-containing protein [Caulobacteraceae bacterium XZ-24]